MANATKRPQTTVDRLNDSLDAAQKAATSLRDDIGAGDATCCGTWSA